MQEFYLIVNWLVTISLIGLGLATLVKNHTILLNRVFALFTLTVGIWIISSYISNDTVNSATVSVYGNYFVFLFSYISAFLLLWFSIALANDKAASKIVKRLTIPILLIGSINITPLVVAGVKQQGGVYAIKFGSLAILYFISILALLVSAMLVLRKNIKRTEGEQRSGLIVLYRSMGIALPILLLTEFILPSITGWFGLTNIGIIAMVIPAVAIYYSVVKLKMFNLRLVIVRSLAYLATLSFISIVYSFTSYYVTTLITQAHHSVVLGDLLNVVLIIVAVVGYTPLKSIFNRLTNRFFYRDAYDPQQLFESMNRLHISTIDLDKLLSGSSALLVERLKLDFCVFSLSGTSYSAERLVESGVKKMRHDDITKALTDINIRSEGAVVVANLSSDRAVFKKNLESIGIELLVSLESSLGNESKSLGYLILGHKKSGNPYSNQDIRVINTLAKELIVAIQNAQHFEEIQNFNLTLQGKVDEATRKLRRANEKLKALDESKDDFISMASHQLRTPLTSIKGYISMVLEGDAGKVSPMQHEMLGQAFFSSQRMVYLISDLLNVSRLKTGKFIIERAKVNLATMVAQELDQLKETAAARQLTLTHEAPDNFPDLMLDETKTRQVIMNFVDNAIYYTPAGGHINVKLIDNPTSIELRVIDDGIGVSKADQHHLFTKFYRAGNARKARPDGTGLGLFMAKKVIIAEEGSLIFDSTEGKGSTFGFVFYKSKAGVSK